MKQTELNFDAVWMPVRRCGSGMKALEGYIRARTMSLAVEAARAAHGPATAVVRCGPKFAEYLIQGK